MIRIFVAMLMVGMFAVPVAAQTGVNEGEISRTTNEVANEVMSPFCPGKTLAMCPSPAASEVRRDVQKMARDGMTTDEIKQALIDEYGDEFKIIEPGAFDNTVILSLIIAGLLLCIGVVLFISKRRRTDDDKDDKDDEDSDDSGGGRSKSDSGAGKDGDVEDPYLSALRDEYRS